MTIETEYQVIWEQGGAVFKINRPRKLNALTKPVLDGLSACLDRLEDVSGRYLIIIGEGERAFSAGTDLGEIDYKTAGAAEERADFARRLFYKLSQARVISVAALNGAAYGGGLELALACTFRISSPDVRLSLPEIKLGAMPSYGGTQFLPALIGAARALDLMITGRSVDAHEALGMGLVTRIASTDEPLLVQVKSFLAGVLSSSQVAVQGIRAAVASAGHAVSEAGLDAEGRAVGHVSASREAREGISAFLENRSRARGSD